jgi:hypothetical protein
MIVSKEPVTLFVSVINKVITNANHLWLEVDAYRITKTAFDYIHAYNIVRTHLDLIIRMDRIGNVRK